MKNITVIGSGTMGNGIAHVFAQKGYRVSLVDIRQDALDRALATIGKNMDRQISKGLLDENAKRESLANISTYTDLKMGVQKADLVIEAATEQESIKLDIFRKLDELCPADTILSSNTSSISITRIAAVTKRPQQVIGMHFMNPVPVMKLVEVIRGYATSDSVTETIMTLSRQLDKVPVEVNDYPGFVANRILMPMINEAIYSLYEGVAGVEEIDTVMKLGMAHPMGPLQLADFIGLDVCLSILKVLQEGFGNPKYAPCPLLVNMVTAGHLGTKSGSWILQLEPGQQGTYRCRSIQKKINQIQSHFQKPPLCPQRRLFLYMAAGNPGGSPGGLKIKAPSNTINVQHLSCKKHPRQYTAFHGLGVNAAQAYATAGHKFFLEGCFARHRMTVPVKHFQQSIQGFLAKLQPALLLANSCFLAQMHPQTARQVKQGVFMHFLLGVGQSVALQLLAQGFFFRHGYPP
ncbi:putative 3-hydroxybutyryl-CoA dehydrogenase [Cesiribacter andamanensis AMV16]|uniref:Putative 3-hydroxybutyryl-CoA dehydrogenase n=1 Tax=Cesiribacter andamanensis AMV16 TaxID=1279009 RepID=M7NM87_9BACT|nr:putative 3-hydroxybutyryl-CoA dehydrogenase [Cesiribacter andamanensis AMV16]